MDNEVRKVYKGKWGYLDNYLLNEIKRFSYKCKSTSPILAGLFVKINGEPKRVDYVFSRYNIDGKIIADDISINSLRMKMLLNNIIGVEIKDEDYCKVLVIIREVLL